MYYDHEACACYHGNDRVYYDYENDHVYDER